MGGCGSGLGALHGAAEHGLDGVLEIRLTFALLARASPSGRVAHHPNKKFRTTERLVMNAFQSVATASRLAKTTALLLLAWQLRQHWRKLRRRDCVLSLCANRGCLVHLMSLGVDDGGVSPAVQALHSTLSRPFAN